jgi:Putative restriction endonuclease
MSISTIKMTARQFLQLGEDPAGVRLELVDGEVALSPSPNPEHSYADRKLTIILGNHIHANDLGALFGDVDTIFGEFDIRRPISSFSRKADCISSATRPWKARRTYALRSSARPAPRSTANRSSNSTKAGASPTTGSSILRPSPSKGLN